ncbi:DUF6889 family protein [Klebsiella oxytoca]
MCPPLARWSDICDGTYSLEDIQEMNDVLDEIYEVAKPNQP